MKSLSSVRYVIVIPAYNESKALPIQIEKILLQVRNEPSILIMDDSGREEFAKTKEKLAALPWEFHERITHIGNQSRSGRGAAVKRGIGVALAKFPNCTFILEADADGSHQASDIDAILNEEQNFDVLIGSRYLRESRIEGWTLRRRALSRILNFCIPRILNLPVKDVTNGLRRYSRRAAEVLVDSDSVSTGFIYLFEQLKLLNLRGFSSSEFPITFKDRIAGTSTVTYRELMDSAVGLFRIIRLRKL